MQKPSTRKTQDKPHQKNREPSSHSMLKSSPGSLVSRWGFVVLVVLFLLLTLLVRNTAYFGIDLQITQTLQRISLPVFAEVMRLVSWIGFFPQSILITLMILFLFSSFGYKWAAVLGALAALFNISFNSLLKILILRPRPEADLVNVIHELSSYSFPSGHVMFYTGFFGFIWFLIYVLFSKSWIRSLSLFVLGSLIFLVGLSRIYLGHHWASDVAGGYLMGTLVVFITIRIYHWGKTRYFTPPRAAVE